jgi:hypothetical protein
MARQQVGRKRDRIAEGASLVTATDRNSTRRCGPFRGRRGNLLAGRAGGFDGRVIFAPWGSIFAPDSVLGVFGSLPG